MIPLSELLGEFKLRNLHQVYREGRNYPVWEVGPRGRNYQWTIPNAAVERLHQLCRGDVVTTKEAALRLEPYAETLGLPYTYGWKLPFYVQDILLIMVATGKAEMGKQGRSNVYRVR